MYCQNCGRYIEGDATICQDCAAGENPSSNDPRPPAPQGQVPPATPGPSPQKKGPWLWVLVAVVAVVLIALVAFFAFGAPGALSGDRSAGTEAVQDTGTQGAGTGTEASGGTDKDASAPAVAPAKQEPATVEYDWEIDDGLVQFDSTGSEAGVDKVDDAIEARADKAERDMSGYDVTTRADCVYFKNGYAGVLSSWEAKFPSGMGGSDGASYALYDLGTGAEVSPYDIGIGLTPEMVDQAIATDAANTGASAAESYVNEPILVGDTVYVWFTTNSQSFGMRPVLSWDEGSGTWAQADGSGRAVGFVDIDSLVTSTRTMKVPLS